MSNPLHALLARWHKRSPHVRDQAAALRDLLTASPELVCELSEQTGCLTTTFVPGDPYQSAYLEGRRAILNELFLLAGLTERDVLDALAASQLRDEDLLTVHDRGED